MSNDIRDITSPAELEKLRQMARSQIIKETMEMSASEQQGYIRKEIARVEGVAERTASPKIRTRMLCLSDYFKSHLRVDIGC